MSRYCQQCGAPLPAGGPVYLATWYGMSRREELLTGHDASAPHEVIGGGATVCSDCALGLCGCYRVVRDGALAGTGWRW